MEHPWKNIMQGKIFGHPVHCMLVHFPIALFSAAFLFDVAGIVLNKPVLHLSSFYVVLLGLTGGVPAAIFGFIDYIRLGDRPKVFSKASWHAGIQFVVLSAFAVIAMLKYRAYPGQAAPGLLQLSMMGIALAGMLAGNYLGGELVFRYKIGIEEKEGED